MWTDNTAPKAPPILDTAYLERLQKHLGEDVTRELMADGMLELSDRLDRIQKLVEKGRIAELQKLTHDIAGSAGHLGLSALSYHASVANAELRGSIGAKTQAIMKPMLNCRGQSLDSLALFCNIGPVEAEKKSATG